MMKPWRVWLLLCLMLLVPFRGAVAAAMLCPPSAEHHAPAVQADAHAHHHAAGQHAAADSPQHDQHDQQHDDRCRLCAAFCSVAGIVHTAPAGPVAASAIATVFPELAAPAPHFLADGQERPPRSC